jgi:hypothetical protein
MDRVIQIGFSALLKLPRANVKTHFGQLEGGARGCEEVALQLGILRHFRNKGFYGLRMGAQHVLDMMFGVIDKT